LVPAKFRWEKGCGDFPLDSKIAPGAQIWGKIENIGKRVFPLLPFHSGFNIITLKEDVGRTELNLEGNKSLSVIN
jgi:hypothetical protein